jgi:transcriptional regulator with XRE-family HTH domain
MNPRSDIHDRLAASLRETRKARGLSLDAVAKLSGVSRSMVSQIERGESSPTVATLWNLTQALQVDFAGLLEGKPEPGIVVIRAAAAPVILGRGISVSIRILSPAEAVGEVTFSRGVGFAQLQGASPRTLGAGLPLQL